MKMGRYTRREFVRAVASAGAGVYVSGFLGCGGESGGQKVGPRTLRANEMSDKLAVTADGAIEDMVRRVVKALGGMEKLVKKGDTVVVKPNIGWASPPELAACSNPQTVATVVKLCVEAGAETVKVFDRPCEDKRRTYSESGIEKAAKDAGAEVTFIDDSGFVELDMSKGKALTKWPVYREALECDVLINVPIPKAHNSTGLTLSLKNLMGIAGGNRGVWHKDLHTSIADFYAVVPCDLSVIDGYRIMFKHGPRGGRPDDVKLMRTIAVCKDNVAADAFAARELFDMTPDHVGYIKQAHDRGLGDMNYESRLLRV